MRARKYNKRVEIYQTTPKSNGYTVNGGTDETLIATSWCQIVTLDKISRNTDLGIIDTTNTVVMRLRKRNDLNYNGINQFFKYRGLKYIIQGHPVNVGFEDREIQITLVRQPSKIAETMQPIGNGFPLQLPFQLK